jgi:hypothetical protein
MPEQRDASSYDGILDNYAPAQQEYLDNKQEQELVARLDKAFEDSYELRIPYERDWELYRLYLKGEQLIMRHRDTGEIVRLTSEDSKRLRSVNNVLRPTARSLVGKLSRTIPTCVVLPATADFEELHGARAATALLEYARRKEDLDLKYVEAMEYLPWAGNALLQLVWNRQGGRRLAWCEVCGFNDADMELVGQPCPQCSAQRENEVAQQQMEHEQAGMMALQQASAELPPDYMGAPLTPEDIPQVAPPDMQQMGPLGLDQEPPALVEISEGDFEVRVRDVRGFYSEPGAESLKAANWVGYRTAIPVHEARRMFPHFQHIIKSEENIEADRTAEMRFNSVDSYGEVEYLNDHCYLYEFHEKPTEAYPKGRVIFKVNNRIVELMDGQGGRPENPYAILGRFPFYMFQFDINKGEFWAEPFLAQAWHRQREINQLETQIREHVELMLKPKFLNPIGSRIGQEEFTATSAQVIKYNAAAGKPAFLDPMPLSQQVFARRNELVGDVRFQASVTEQEAGVSQSDPNGRAMAIIEAEADQQVGSILLRIHSEWRELHRGILQLFREFAQEDRLWTIMGPDGLRTYSFNDMVLQPGHDVQIEQDDGLSRNPAIRLQQSIDIKNAAPELFLDPMTGMPDAKKFSRYARLSIRDAGYEIEATERAAASAIPDMVKEGQPFMPQPEDDPQIFAEELLGWLRGPGRRDPELAAQVRQIWMFYAMWAMQGGPPGQLGGPMGGPGAGPGGPDQSAPGGSANNPGNIASDASAMTGQADSAAEGQAQVQSSHEG